MAFLEEYAHLTKPQDKLLWKDFPFPAVFAVIASSKADALTNKTKVSCRKSGEDDYSRFFYSRGAFSLHTHFFREAQPRFVGTYWPQGPVTRLTLGLDLQAQWLAEAGIHINRPNLNASFLIDSARRLRLSAVSGQESFGIGVDAGFCLQQRRFSTYNAACWAKSAKHRAVLTHESTDPLQYSLGTVAFSFLYTLNDKLSVAGRVASTREAQLAVKTQDAKQTTKASLHSDGRVNFSVARQLTENIGMVSCCSVNLVSFKKQAGTVLEYGFAVKIY